MALRSPLFVSGASAGVTAPADARVALASLLSQPGVLNGYAVTGSTSGPNMKYNVAAGAAATQRGVLATDGLYLVPNDGAVTVDSGAPAPSSGTRWDLVWVRCLNAFGSDGFGDPNSTPVFGVTVGTAGSTPTKPYASVPAGALVLAESSVGTNIANASLATISQVAKRTLITTLDTGWIPVTNLQSGWSLSSLPLIVRQIGNRVELRGGLVDSLFSTTTFLTVANLPSTVAWPPETIVLPMVYGPTERGARILVDGTIQFYANGASSIAYQLDSMYYLID